MTNTIAAAPVPWPLGATEVTDWADVGKPEQFRCFAGPIREVPELRYSDDCPVTVSIDGTQLLNGTVEERCIRLTGISWEDMLTSSSARKLATVLAEAADDLDRLDGPR